MLSSPSGPLALAEEAAQHDQVDCVAHAVQVIFLQFQPAQMRALEYCVPTQRDMNRRIRGRKSAFRETGIFTARKDVLVSGKWKLDRLFKLGAKTKKKGNGLQKVAKVAASNKSLMA